LRPSACCGDATSASCAGGRAVSQPASWRQRCCCPAVRGDPGWLKRAFRMTIASARARRGPRRPADADSEVRRARCQRRSARTGRGSNTAAARTRVANRAPPPRHDALVAFAAAGRRAQPSLVNLMRNLRLERGRARRADGRNRRRAPAICGSGHLRDGSTHWLGVTGLPSPVDASTVQ